jgi:hypothetical protein
VKPSVEIRISVYQSASSEFPNYRGDRRRGGPAAVRWVRGAPKDGVVGGPKDGVVGGGRWEEIAKRRRSL